MQSDVRLVVKVKNLIAFIVGGGWVRRSAAMGFVEVPWLEWVRIRRSLRACVKTQRQEMISSLLSPVSNNVFVWAA